MRTLTIQKTNNQVRVITDTRKIKPYIKRVTPRKKKRKNG